jgi:mRNA interferase MazF
MFHVKVIISGLILSPYEYNKKTGLMIVCPITSKVKGYPFEVKVEGQKISGVILADQVKSLDWKSRRASLIEKGKAHTLVEVQGKLLALLD